MGRVGVVVVGGGGRAGEGSVVIFCLLCRDVYYKEPQLRIVYH